MSILISQMINTKDISTIVDVENHVTTTTGNPHSVTKSDVGLGNANNTSDTDKPVSTLQQSALDDKQNISEKGVANGYAGLDDAGLVPTTQLPSYVDDVLEFANLAALPTTGETGKIYVTLDDNKTHRWSGSSYIQITSGAVDSVDGRTGVVDLSSVYEAENPNIQTHIGTTTGNPHSVTKSDVGLGNVVNINTTNASNITSGTLADARIASTITRDSELTAGLSTKSDTNHNHDSSYEAKNANIQTHIGTTTGNPHSVTKSDVGLGNVVNVDTTNASNITTGTLADARIASTITRDSELTAGLNLKQSLSEKGQANGYASLDGSGLVPTTQLPSYVDDVLEFVNFAALPTTGVAGKIYVTKDDNKTYRWSGTTYVQITSGAVDSVDGRTGVVSLSTVYEAKNANIQTHIGTTTGNPHSVTKSDVGLGNVADIDTTNASNITTGTLADARIASTITRDSELVVYKKIINTSTSYSDDPDSFTDGIRLCNHANCPTSKFGSGTYWYIQSFFHSSAQVSSNCTQIATSYTGGAAEMFVRHRYSGVWTDWANCTSGRIDEFNNIGNAGTSLSVDCTAYDTHMFTCDQSTLTLTASNLAVGRTVSLVITNGGSCTITWPTGTQWPDGGTAPTLTAAGTDRIVLQRISSTVIHAQSGGADFA